VVQTTVAAAASHASVVPMSVQLRRAFRTRPRPIAAVSGSVQPYAPQSAPRARSISPSRFPVLASIPAGAFESSSNLQQFSLELGCTR
jgi:hypothetical protein